MRNYLCKLIVVALVGGTFPLAVSSIDAVYSQKFESDVGIYTRMLLFCHLAERSMFFGSLYPPFDQGSDFPKSTQGNTGSLMKVSLLTSYTFDTC
jgi:hypothetical protein